MPGRLRRAAHRSAGQGQSPAGPATAPRRQWKSQFRYGLASAVAHPVPPDQGKPTTGPLCSCRRQETRPHQALPESHHAARHFIERLSHELGKDIGEISDGGIKILMDYNWPGNVRERENAVERARVTCRGQELTEDDFSFLALNGLASKPWAVPTGMTLQEMEKQLIDRKSTRLN